MGSNPLQKYCFFLTYANKTQKNRPDWSDFSVFIYDLLMYDVRFIYDLALRGNVRFSDLRPFSPS